MHHTLHTSVKVQHTLKSITHCFQSPTARCFATLAAAKGHNKASIHLTFSVVSLLHSDGEGTRDDASGCLVHRVGRQGAKVAVQQDLSRA